MKPAELLLAPWHGLRWLVRLLTWPLRWFIFWVMLIVALLVVLIAFYVASDRYTPLTTDAYLQAYVVQVAPRVAGQVIRVHVKENDTVKRGDLLFEIDSRPFAHKVAQWEAKLVSAANQVQQMSTAHAAARAAHARLEAEEVYARAVFGQEERIFKKESTTERKYLDAVQKFKAAVAAVEQSSKLVLRAEQALEARVGAEHALVAEAKAQLEEAKLDLEFTRIYAPADGYITNLQLREGTYAHAGQPVLTCIDSSQWTLIANYRENCLERFAPGQPAWVCFNTYPGRIYHARVASVGWGVGQGQGVPSGQLPAVGNLDSWIKLAQRFQVRLTLDEDEPADLRVGMTATVSVYTDPDHRLNRVTQKLHQVLAWLDYLY